MTEHTATIELLRAVFESAENSIAVLSPVRGVDGRVEDLRLLLLNDHPFNRSAKSDYQGRSYSDVFPSASANGVLEKLLEAAETGEASDFDKLYKDGQDTWYHFTAVNRGGFLVVTAADITARREAETAQLESIEAMEKQQRLYESIISTTPDLVYVFDPQYRFTYANKALLSMWGKTAAESIGKGLRDNGYEEWHALMHEREIDEVIAEKKSIRGTVSFPHAELGSRVYDYIFGPVLDENGEVEAIAGTTRDITDIKQAEEQIRESAARFRNMIEQAPVAILLARGEDQVGESVNRPMLRFMNKTEEHQVIGKTLLEALPELEGQPVLDIVADVLKTGNPFRGDEQRVDFLIDGKMEPRYFNLSYDRIDGLGEIPAVLHMAIDVTEQVLTRQKIEESEHRYRILSETLEQQVTERTKELQRSNGDLQQFAHVASHDLKEPVRKIKTFAGRLETQLDGKLDEAAARFIERIHAAADRMSTMIDGVLKYSSINSGTQKSALTDLNEVMGNIESDLEISLERSGGTIKYKDLPSLEGASVLLYQLFYNLINNSIKFAQAGTAPVITVSAELLEEDGRELARITVGDNGIGFDEEHAASIFETFTRLNSKDQYEGTGLGLSLCKKIAERHGGTIVASSSRGKGASFIVTLPLHQSQTSI
jgi:PAS domain S-box-containing protein